MGFLDEALSVEDLPVSETSYEPIPAGWYNATITSAELKNTKVGGGQYIRLRYDVTGPSHQGRVVFGNLNIRNASPEAERIGRQQLGEVMRAIGLARIQDTDQFVGGALSIKVAIKESAQYGAQNEVKGYKAIEGAKAPAAAPKAAAPAPAAAKAAPPWAK
jgi:hypothetical protein